MEINAEVLIAANTGFNTAFQAGLAQAPSQWQRVASRFTSSGFKEVYPWLGDLPGMKEWVGPRQINALKTYSYELLNKDWEDTIAVSRNAIEDDQLGVYGTRFTALGKAVGASKDMLVFANMKAGFTSDCYDGQTFFDTDHPVLDKNGNVTQVANTDGGSGEPWFLIDSKQPIAPFILQIRREAQFVSMTDPTNPHVFMNKEFLYGADGRWAAGFGFWQWCWGSKQTLDSTHYATARAALTGMKGDYARPIGVVPDLLVVGPANEQKGRQLLNSEYGTGGVTNEWKGTAELLVVPWLA
jgi:phage major head subunit gpT-like protein